MWPFHATRAQLAWIWLTFKKFAMRLNKHAKPHLDPSLQRPRHYDFIFHAVTPLSLWEYSLPGDVRSACHDAR